MKKWVKGDWSKSKLKTLFEIFWTYVNPWRFHLWILTRVERHTRWLEWFHSLHYQNIHPLWVEWLQLECEFDCKTIQHLFEGSEGKRRGMGRGRVGKEGKGIRRQKIIQLNTFWEGLRRAAWRIQANINVEKGNRLTSKEHAETNKSSPSIRFVENKLPWIWLWRGLIGGGSHEEVLRFLIGARNRVNK